MDHAEPIAGPWSSGTRFVAGVLLAFVGFCAFFVAGETLDDPGGWAGVGYVAVWLVPLLGLSALAVWRPRVAVPVLTVLVVLLAAVVVFGGLRVWGLDRFEDRRGPVRAIAMVALAGPLAVLAWSQPRRAGRLLAVLGGAAFAATALAVRSAPLMAFGVPLLGAGLLLWILAPAEPADGGGPDPGGS